MVENQIAILSELEQLQRQTEEIGRKFKLTKSLFSRGSAEKHKSRIMLVENAIGNTRQGIEILAERISED